MITSKLMVCRIKSDFAIAYTFTLQFEILKKQQWFIISLLFVSNNFMKKRNNAKFRDLVFDCDTGQTSTAYKRMGIHLQSTRWRTYPKFYLRDAILARYYSYGPVSVCLPVCCCYRRICVTRDCSATVLLSQDGSVSKRLNLSDWF